MAEEMKDIHRDNNFETSYLGNDWPEKEGGNGTEVYFENKHAKFPTENTQPFMSRNFLVNNRSRNLSI